MKHFALFYLSKSQGHLITSGGHGEKTREYITVTDGVLTVECHDHVQEIHRGQVYKFETDQPHLYRNDGDRVASCMCFFWDYTNIR